MASTLTTSSTANIKRLLFVQIRKKLPEGVSRVQIDEPPGITGYAIQCRVELRVHFEGYPATQYTDINFGIGYIMDRPQDMQSAAEIAKLVDNAARKISAEFCTLLTRKTYDQRQPDGSTKPFKFDDFKFWYEI